MISKRRKNQNQISEENEQSLFNNDSLLEYQNKSLCTIINDLKEKMEEKDKTCEELNQKFTNLSEVFVQISGTLEEMSAACSLALMKNKIEIPENDQKPGEYFGGAADILSAIVNQQAKDKQKSTTPEFEVVQKLKNSINTIITKILPILQANHSVLINNSSNSEVQEINAKLEEAICKQTQNLVKYQNEKESLKSQCEIYQSKLNEISSQIEPLKLKNLQLKRTINVNPKIPYINFEKKFFNKQTEEHKHVCMICGKDMNEINENSENSGKETEANVKESEATSLLVKEKKALEDKIKELHKELEEVKYTKVDVTEESIQKSACFQSLVSQAENLLSKVVGLQKINIDLQNKNNTLNFMKEANISQITQQFKESIENLNQKVFESSKLIERYKQQINDLTVKIQSYENIINAKDSIDMNSLYDTFNKDKEQLIQQMEYIKVVKKEYLNKYDDECEKNKINEQTIIKLKTELENYKQLLHSNMDEKKSKMDDKNESIKRKNEVIDILEKENKRLQNDLGQERNHNEKIIEMIEANEKGITDLNNVIRNLKNELQKAKEIQAKMSNEKLRDNQTILKLNESKTIYEEKINVLKDQIENYKIYVTKIGNELDQYKKLSSLLQETVKVNETDIDNLKKLASEKLKEIAKEKSANAELEKKNEEINSQYIKIVGELDVLKTCYNTLKNGETAQVQPKEYEILKKENDRYREMIMCNICKINIKNVVINRCYHFFCKECVEKTLNTRNRKCPICRESISQNDIKKIYWD